MNIAFKEEFDPNDSPNAEAVRIASVWAKADKQGERAQSTRLEVGRRLLALHKRVVIDKEEIASTCNGRLDWWGWIRSQVGRSKRDIEKIMALARAEDPAAAVEAERSYNRKAKQKSRMRLTVKRTSKAKVIPLQPDIVQRALALVEEMTSRQRMMFFAIMGKKYPGFTAPGMTEKEDEYA